MIDRRHLLAGSLGLALVLAACGTGAIPSAGAPGATGVPVPGATEPASPASPASPSERDPESGSGSRPGAGILDPSQIGGVFDPGGASGPDGEPRLVTPAANVRDVRQVAATRLEAAVDGRRVAVRVSWWSGVEPCAALARIDVVESGKEITLTVHEGDAAAPGTMCTQQLVYKAAVVDLGELDPGTWTIRAVGEAAPVEVVVAG